MKKKLMVLLTAVILLISSVSVPFEVRAEEDKVYPLYDPQVIDSNYYVYGPSIQMNQYSGCISGCSVISPRQDVIDLVGGFTREDWDRGTPEVIMYVGDHYDESEDRKLINQTVTEFGGTVVCALDLQLFKFDGATNIRFEELDETIQIIIGIPSEANYKNLWEIQSDQNQEFCMVRVHDGQVEILKDIDTDRKTLTFESDKFSIYAMVYATAGNVDTYLANKAAVPETTSKVSETSANDLDEVPKTGDPAWEASIPCGRPCRRVDMIL